MTTKRQCGDCAACCTVLGVSEFKKPMYQTCKELCKQGCGIYNTRPATCADYVCGWLQGAMGPLDRPDKLGIIMDHINGKTHIREVWPGAFEKPASRKIVKLISSKTTTFLIFADGRCKLLGPRGEVNAIIREATAQEQQANV